MCSWTDYTSYALCSVEAFKLVKTVKRWSEFLQKYTDSGTETTLLAGYNILVFKYVKISAGLPLLFIGATREKSSKLDIA